MNVGLSQMSSEAARNMNAMVADGRGTVRLVVELTPVLRVQGFFCSADPKQAAIPLFLVRREPESGTVN
jgi:hypothetical protein